MVTIANPYANLELRIPEHEWDAVKRYTTTFRPEDGSTADIDRSPFARYVDLWWIALCLGVREGRKSVPAKWHTFVTGVVLNQEPWRIRHLELIALADEGPSVLDEPGKVIAIANGYAATGIPVLIDAMTGQTEPIWAVTSFLRSTVEGDGEGSGAS
jgi:hypothetical protein